MFKCKVCAEKDRRISDLKEQIALLKSLAVPHVPGLEPHTSLMEADGILSGQQHVIEIPSAEETADATVVDETSYEASRILSANY